MEDDSPAKRDLIHACHNLISILDRVEKALTIVCKTHGYGIVFFFNRGDNRL